MSNNNAVLARNTEKAPINSLYSQTVAFSHYNNLSAQLPVDPKSGKATRIGRKLNEKGALVRYSKKSGEEIK